jgi:hypothetical protein
MARHFAGSRGLVRLLLPGHTLAGVWGGRPGAAAEHARDINAC